VPPPSHPENTVEGMQQVIRRINGRGKKEWSVGGRVLLRVIPLQVVLLSIRFSEFL